MSDIPVTVATAENTPRQAVIDVRSSIDWLESQGYESIGICGTSLGSCYAFLASTHDQTFLSSFMLSLPLLNVLAQKASDFTR